MNYQIAGINNDSLYKFIAILGVVLFLSPSLINKDMLDLKLEIVEHNKNIELLENKMEFISIEQSDLKDDVLMLEDFIDDTTSRIQKNYKDLLFELKELQGRSKPDDTIDDATKEKIKLLFNNVKIQNRIEEDKLNQAGVLLADNKLKLSQQKDILDSSYILGINLKYESEKLKVKERRYKFDLMLELSSRIIGVLLMCFGFILWYYKVQYFEDIDKAKRKKNNQEEV